MSIPVKDVADAMGDNPSSLRNSMKASGVSRRQQSMTINHSRLSDEDSSPRRYAVYIPSNKLPSAQVNETKLKMVLKQLKKNDRNTLHTSRW